MISAPAESAGGANPPNRKPIRLRLGLWVAVAVVFALQVAVAFWLGNPPPAKPSKPQAAPVITLGVNGSAELLALQDPTLFVLPHRDNFSGDAWLKIPPQTFAPTNWTEPARPLNLPPEQLGAAFEAFMQTNLPPRFHPAIDSGLGAIDAGTTPMPSISVPSDLRIEGDLAQLRLLTPLRLPPQTNVDLLTNTVVQLVVNGEGFPYSVVILASSGDPARADVAALKFAKMVRFAPAQEAALGTVPLDKMTLGKLIFEWQTLPPLPTDSPPADP